MSQIVITPLACEPGVQRDGTPFSSKRYLDGCWVRFVNNQPKKIGGYYAIAYMRNTQRDYKLESPFLLQATNGPDQCMFVISANQSNLYLTIIQTYKENAIVAAENIKQILGDSLIEYQALNYKSGVGSFCELTFKGSLYPHWYYLPSFNAQDITSVKAGQLYYVDLTPITEETGDAILTKVEDYLTKKTVTASGGVWCAQTFPLIIVYGSNGSLIYNDVFFPGNPKDDNQTPLNTWVDQNGNYYTKQIAQCKIVAMKSTMGSNNLECALAWGLFGLYYLSFQPLLDQTTNLPAELQIVSTVVSTSCSVLGQNTIVEANNMFFWIGLGCFYVYNGTVQELPNSTNKIWFFKNLNREWANISYGVLNTQFSEIWWIFPKGNSTYCNHAIVYNYQTQVWYDTPFIRAAGCPSLLNQTVLYVPPVLTLDELEILRKTQPGTDMSGLDFDSYQLFAHEVGVNAVVLDSQNNPESNPIVSHFTYNMTSLFNTQNAQNRSILNVMLEPDIIMPDNTELSLKVLNIPFPADWLYGTPQLTSEPKPVDDPTAGFYVFNNKRRFIYLHSMGRIVTIKLMSNCIDGDYWMGSCLWHWQYGSVNPSTPDTIVV
jgi:hypothetical protein